MVSMGLSDGVFEREDFMILQKLLSQKSVITNILCRTAGAKKANRQGSLHALT
jgi:hypothetical protein